MDSTVTLKDEKVIIWKKIFIDFLSNIASRNGRAYLGRPKSSIVEIEGKDYLVEAVQYKADIAFMIYNQPIELQRIVVLYDVLRTEGGSIIINQFGVKGFSVRLEKMDICIEEYECKNNEITLCANKALTKAVILFKKAHNLLYFLERTGWNHSNIKIVFKWNSYTANLQLKRILFDKCIFDSIVYFPLTREIPSPDESINGTFRRMLFLELINYSERSEVISGGYEFIEAVQIPLLDTHNGIPNTVFERVEMPQFPINVAASKLLQKLTTMCENPVSDYLWSYASEIIIKFLLSASYRSDIPHILDGILQFSKEDCSINQKQVDFLSEKFLLDRGQESIKDFYKLVEFLEPLCKLTSEKGGVKRPFFGYSKDVLRKGMSGYSWFQNNVSNVLPFHAPNEKTYVSSLAYYTDSNVWLEEIQKEISDINAFNQQCINN